MSKHKKYLSHLSPLIALQSFGFAKSDRCDRCF